MRDTRIDFLRFTGLMMIILAHVYPPPWLFQLRNFDVPLMVFISGLSYRLSVKDEPYRSYVWARVQRLVFPVWIFLTLFFTLLALTAYPMPLPSFYTIWRSYLLVDGIGYVWVIRIFLFVALIGPLVYWYHLRQRSHAWYLSSLALIYASYEAMVAWLQPTDPLTRLLLTHVVYYVIPYGLIFAIGLRVPDLSQAALVRLLALCSAGYLVWLGYYGLIQEGAGWLPTQKFKYPPTSYYLSFALMMAFVLYLASERIMAFCQQVRLESLILFIGSNSIWIYLWHILYLQVFKSLDGFVSWYLSVLLCSILTTYLQVQLVQRLLEGVTDKAKKKLVRTLFTG